MAEHARRQRLHPDPPASSAALEGLGGRGLPQTGGRSATRRQTGGTAADRRQRRHGGGTAARRASIAAAVGGGRTQAAAGSALLRHLEATPVGFGTLGRQPQPAHSATRARER